MQFTYHKEIFDPSKYLGLNMFFDYFLSELIPNYIHKLPKIVLSSCCM